MLGELVLRAEAEAKGLRRMALSGARDGIPEEFRRIVKIRELFRTERILERTAVVDLEGIGIDLISVIRLEVDKIPTKDISRINKALRPFYYWVFGKDQLLMTGHKEYGELVGDMRGLGKVKGLKIADVQTFDVRSSKVVWGLDRFPVSI